MLTMQLSGDRELLATLEDKPAQLLEALRVRIDYWNARVMELVIQKLSGEVLQVRSGKLLRSVQLVPANITTDGKVDGGGVISSGGDAFYGRFQEEGTSRPYVIVSSHALYFLVNNRAVFARSVIHPPIQQRSFMRSAQDEIGPQVPPDLQETVYRVLSAKP